MAKFTIAKGTTDFSSYVYAQSSGAAVGISGITSGATGLTCYYARARSSAVSIPLVNLATISSGHLDGGILQVDGTNMPGVYRLDLPDAVFATGADGAVVVLQGAATLSPIIFEFQLSNFNLNDDTPNVTVSDIANGAITADAIATGAIDADAIADNAIDSGAIAQNAIDADSIKDDAVTKIQNGLATPTNITSGLITTVTNLTNLPAVTTDWLTAAGVKADAVTKIQTGLALDATLTAIKGAGWTDETLTALMTAIEGISAGSGASVADILNALLASYTVSGSVGESLGRLDNIQAKTDLITTGTTLSIASAVSGSTITAHRGDTLSAALENIGALTNNSKVWFTVKRDFEDADSAAIVQIEKTGGLLYINGAAGTAGNGSLTINDEASGDVTIVLAAAETAKLGVGSYQYDIQVLRSAGTPVSTLTYGEFIVDADVTKATA